MTCGSTIFSPGAFPGNCGGDTRSPLGTGQIIIPLLPITLKRPKLKPSSIAAF